LTTASQANPSLLKILENAGSLPERASLLHPSVKTKDKENYRRQREQFLCCYCLSQERKKKLD